MLVNELDPGTHPFRKGAIFMRYLGRFLEQGPDVFWFWKEEQLPFSASEKEGNYFVGISKKGTTAFSLFQGGGGGRARTFFGLRTPNNPDFLWISRGFFFRDCWGINFFRFLKEEGKVFFTLRKRGKRTFPSLKRGRGQGFFFEAKNTQNLACVPLRFCLLH